MNKKEKIIKLMAMCKDYGGLLEEALKVFHELRELNDERALLAAKETQELKSRAEKAEAELKNARNELCLKCGKYHEAHNGACEGCRWENK